MVPIGARRYRVPAERLRRYVDDLRRGEVRYQAARERLPLLIAEDVRRQREYGGGAPSDRETARLARAVPVREFVDAVWPAVDAPALVFRLLTDPEFLAGCARGVLEESERHLLAWPAAPRGVRAAPWSMADAVLVDEVAGLLARPDSYGHIVLDEAQDLAPMQCRAVGRRCPTGSVTVLGDLAQGTTPWAAARWPTTLGHLGKPQARVEPLTRGYRVPAEVIALANRLLPHIATGLEPATSVRAGRGSLRVVADPAGAAAASGPAAGVRQVVADPAGAPAAGRPDSELPRVVADPVEARASGLAAEVRRVLAEPGSVGVISADTAVAGVSATLAAAGIPHRVFGDGDGADRDVGGPGLDAGPGPEGPGDGADRDVDPGPEGAPARVSLVPASVTKGLEFDSVVVVEPAAIVAAEPRGLRRLYVVLTRAVSRLVVIHRQPLPAELGR